MKGPVLSAWIAAGVILAASGAQAEPADCDMICHLQGYLSADHMAAPPSDAAPGETPGKRHPRAAGVAPKASKAASKPAGKPEPQAEAAAKPQPKPSTEPPVADATRKAGHGPALGLEAPRTVAIGKVDHAKSVMSKPPKVAATVPGPDLRVVAHAEPPKHRVVAQAVPTPPAPVADKTSKPRRATHAMHRLASTTLPHPVANAGLIPGSARLVPAEFQTFGDL